MASWIQSTLTETSRNKWRPGEPVDEETGVQWIHDSDIPMESRRDGLLPQFVIWAFTMLNSGIVFVTALAIVYFFTVAVGWLLIYNIDSVSQELREQDFGAAFLPITFVISLIANGLYESVLTGTTARISMYLQLLQDLRSLLVALASLRLSMVYTENSKYRPMSKKDLNYTPESRQDAIKHIHNISMVLFLMVKYSYALFNPWDPFDDYKEFISEDDYERFNSLVTKPIGARLKEELIPDVFLNALMFTNVNIVHLNQQKVITDGHFLQFDRHISQITAEVDTITRSMRVQTPPIFENMKYFILGFYLLILVPLLVYSTVETWIVLVVPAVLIMYLGIPLYGRWLGDPMSRYPKYQGSRVRAWRNALYREVHELLLKDPPSDVFRDFWDVTVNEDGGPENDTSNIR